VICADEVSSFAVFVFLDFDAFLTLDRVFKDRTGEHDLLWDVFVFGVGDGEWSIQMTSWSSFCCFPFPPNFLDVETSVSTESRCSIVRDVLGDELRFRF